MKEQTFTYPVKRKKIIISVLFVAMEIHQKHDMYPASRNCFKAASLAISALCKASAKLNGLFYVRKTFFLYFLTVNLNNQHRKT